MPSDDLGLASLCCLLSLRACLPAGYVTSVQAFLRVEERDAWMF